MDERSTTLGQPHLRTPLLGPPVVARDATSRRRWAGYFPRASLHDFHLPGTMASRAVSAPVPGRHESGPPAAAQMYDAPRPAFAPRRPSLTRSNAVAGRTRRSLRTSPRDRGDSGVSELGSPTNLFDLSEDSGTDMTQSPVDMQQNRAPADMPVPTSRYSRATIDTTTKEGSGSQGASKKDEDLKAAVLALQQHFEQVRRQLLDVYRNDGHDSPAFEESSRIIQLWQGQFREEDEKRKQNSPGKNGHAHCPTPTAAAATAESSPTSSSSSSPAPAEPVAAAAGDGSNSSSGGGGGGGSSEVTRRMIILRKLAQRQTPNPDSFLDQPMSLPEAIQFSKSLDANQGAALANTTVKTCALCRVPRLMRVPASSTGHEGEDIDIVSEFNSRFGSTSCCSQPVCAKCLPGAFETRISNDWWYDLGLPHWIKCLVKDCRARLPIRHAEDLARLLRGIDPKALHKVTMFERACVLRASLESLSPRPANAALRVASALHFQFLSHGRIHEFFNLRHHVGPTAAELLPVTWQGQQLDVPIFTSLLVCGRRNSSGGIDGIAAPSFPLLPSPAMRDCIVCASSIPDVVDGTAEDEARWAEATAGYDGDWQTRVRSFPAPSVVAECAARHALDICRACVARHLEAQLDLLGRAGCDRLACPSPDCGHIYSHAQLRLLASPDTFARYDKLRLLSVLASMPNFRWCLREGCSSGQIYDMPEEDEGDQQEERGLGLMGRTTTTTTSAAELRNQIVCADCDFEMCYHHQTPWHEGQSCRGYDAFLRGEPDPDDTRKTEAWLRQHTKACPGPRCGVPVEKKGGCFHMTCRSCAFEFCWECLADWKRVVRRRFRVAGAEEYDPDGHNPGCYFRSVDALEPTMLYGDDLEEALRLERAERR